MTTTIRPSGLNNDKLFPQFRTALSTKYKMEEAVDEGDSIILDLSRAEWFAPTFLTPISVIVNQYRSSGHDIRVQFPRKRGVSKYLDMIDFPEGTASPSEKYDNTLPLCSFETESERDVINSVASKMRDILREQFLEETGEITWLEYPFSEIIDNVDTHSQCDFGSLLVQNYPGKEFLDLCIADDGISIPGSYREFDIDIESDEDALRKALEDGISTRPDSGMDRGYGLRTTSDMICSGLDGTVFLSSQSASLIQYPDTTYSSDNDYKWDGTVFAARVYTPDDDFNYLDYITPN